MALSDFTELLNVLENSVNKDPRKFFTLVKELIKISSQNPKVLSFSDKEYEHMSLDEALDSHLNKLYGTYERVGRESCIKACAESSTWS